MPRFHLHAAPLGTADGIDLLMNPAQWLFLGVIYLCDAKPENRIAVQYLPKIIPNTKEKL